MKMIKHICDGEIIAYYPLETFDRRDGETDIELSKRVALSMPFYEDVIELIDRQIATGEGLCIGDPMSIVKIRDTVLATWEEINVRQ